MGFGRIVFQSELLGQHGARPLKEARFRESSPLFSFHQGCKTKKKKGENSYVWSIFWTLQARGQELCVMFVKLEPEIYALWLESKHRQKKGVCLFNLLTFCPMTNSINQWTFAEVGAAPVSGVQFSACPRRNNILTDRIFGARGFQMLLVRWKSLREGEKKKVQRYHL